jgi:hypothetical protein
MKDKLLNLIDTILKRTIGEPWDTMPFPINMKSWIDIYIEYPTSRTLLSQDDMNSIAVYLFRRPYFKPITTWVDRHTMEEFNERLDEQLKAYGFNCSLTYRRIELHNNNPNIVGDVEYKYEVVYRDLKVISDAELHNILDV